MRHHLAFSLTRCILAVAAFNSCAHTTSRQARDSAALPSVDSVDRMPASIEDTVRTLDPQKKTVCTITINSDNEKIAFQNALKPQGFNFIELVPSDNRNDDAWFLRACRSGVKCDVVVISGHFGGQFMGESGVNLGVEELEDNSCRTSCDGILKAPKEVFLFGCNTLAGKQRDSRTINQYATILTEHGIRRGEAEQIAAFRYSPIGSSNESRMRRAFKGATKIYGFDSKAPLGREIDRSLNSYLKAVSNYSQHLDTLSKKNPNAALARSLKWTSIVESSGWGDVSLAPACYLNNDHNTTTERLRWIRTALTDQNSALQYSYVIERYLSRMKIEKYPWSAEDQEILNEIAEMTASKSAFENILNHEVKGMLGVQVSLANLMQTLGWWNNQQYRTGLRRLLAASLKNRAGQEQADQICSLEVQADLALADLPALPWDRDLIQTIGCLQPTAVRVINQLTELARSSQDQFARLAAIEALGVAGRRSVEAQLQLIQILSTESDSLIIDRAALALRRGRALDSQVFEQLLKLMRTPGSLLRQSSAADVFGYLRPRDLNIQRALVDILVGDDARVEDLTRVRAGLALASIKPQNRELLQILLNTVLTEHRYSVLYAAADVLAAVRPEDSDFVQTTLTGLKSHSMPTRIATVRILNAIRSRTASVRAAVQAAQTVETEPLLQKQLADLSKALE